MRNPLLFLIAIVGALLINTPTNAQLSGGIPQAIPANLALMGADPSGARDSTAAIQTAVNAACGLTVSPRLFLPTGTYKTTAPITVPCGGIDIGGMYGGTVINYSGAPTAFLFQPTNWLTTTRRNLPVGNAIHDLALSTTTANSSRAIEMDGQTNCLIRNVELTGSQSYNGIRLYGTYKCILENITTGYFISPQHTDIELLGDLSGVCDPALGGPCTGAFPCTLGNCSTRTDVTSLINVDSSGGGGDGILLHNMVFATTGRAIQIENRAFGLRTQCDTGFADITYCPQEINFVDFETEGATTQNFALVDSQSFHCVNCYALSSSPSNLNVVADALNYTGEAGFEWRGGRIIGDGVSGGDCVFLRNWKNIRVSGAILYNCVFVGIDVDANSSKVNLDNNQFCTFGGTTVASAAGIAVQSSANDVNIASSLYYGCTAGLSNSSSLPSTVKEVNANGGPLPTIASGFGTSPTIAGGDNAGRVTVGSGTGIASGVINFGGTYAVAPVCSANDETTANAMQATASITQLTINGTMVASNKITYQCTSYN